MARTMRVVAVGARHVLPEDADVVVAAAAAAPGLARAMTGPDRGPRPPRLVVEGAPDPGALEMALRTTARVAVVEAAAPVGGLAVQRALQLGAEIVVLPRTAVPGAAVQGGAAWYHAWKPSQFDAWAGGLLAGRCLSALDPPAWASIHREGTFLVGPAERKRIVEELLVGTAGDGHDSPEVQARLESVAVQGAGPDRVRVWGTVGLPCEHDAEATARVRIGTEVHDVPTPARPPGKPIVDDEALGTETTMSFPPETGDRRTVSLGRLAHVRVREHGRRAVLAIWTRDPDHWDWLDDIADDDQIRAWVGERHYVRTGLPNLSAVRVLLPGPATDLLERVRYESVEIDAALLSPRGT